MKKKKPLYVVDAFVWVRKKNDSGNIQCYTDEVDGIKTLFGVLFHTIRLLKNNDGVTIMKFDRRNK